MLTCPECDHEVPAPGGSHSYGIGNPETGAINLGADMQTAECPNPECKTPLRKSRDASEWSVNRAKLRGRPE